MSPAAQEIRLKWNVPQSAFMQATDPYVDFESAVRVGKTTALIWKIAQAALVHQGLHAMLSRYTDDALQAQLKPRFYELMPSSVLGDWMPEEEYHGFRNGSRIYLRALKSSEEKTRYAKFTGLTLAIMGVDQPEEMPRDFFDAMKARISQPGMPRQILLTPNPPDLDHWIAREFPEDNSHAGHRYIHGDLYANRANLDPEYIAEMERAYPPGSPLRRRFIEGKRGLTVVGDPVYGGAFRPTFEDRPYHVQEIDASSNLPLLESWDFGHHHPAVLWSQYTPDGRWLIFGEMLGTDQFIEDFAPVVNYARGQLFRDVTEVRACSDPAGADHSGHGTKKTAVDVLREYGITPRWIPGANQPEQRDYAIQEIRALMGRMTPRGPAIVVHPRCHFTIEAFQQGYVWDEGAGLASMPNLRRPKKDGLYDHLMNCAEYTVLSFGVSQAQRRRTSRRIYEPENPRTGY